MLIVFNLLSLTFQSPVKGVFDVEALPLIFSPLGWAVLSTLPGSDWLVRKRLLYNLDFKSLIYLKLFELSCVGEQITGGTSSALHVRPLGQLARVIGDSPFLLFKHWLFSQTRRVLTSLALVAFSLTEITLLKRALLLGHYSLLGVFCMIIV